MLEVFKSKNVTGCTHSNKNSEIFISIILLQGGKNTS